MNPKPSLLFIHRSVGHNLVRDGKLYELVQAGSNPFELSDYDQNTDLLQSTDIPAHAAGWQFPGADTKPADYARLFSDKYLAEANPTLTDILSYDIIVIKSCFPNTRIRSQTMIAATEESYQSIANFFSSQHNKKLIILSSPPLIPLLTLPPFARRARVLADWLSHTHFGPNVFVFDLFGELAIPVGARQANTLRHEYRRQFPFDSHPNVLAGIDLTPKLAQFFQQIADTESN